MTGYLLFDLDNTLYSCRYGLEEKVRSRIQDFCSVYLGINSGEVWKQRVEHGGKYGTTLEWLMEDKGFTDVEAYMAALHPEDEAEILPPDPVLRSFLESVSIPKAILTNSPMEHADRILDKLDINGLFTHVFDIRYFGFKGKPHHDVYRKTLSVLGVNVSDVLFIDDHPGYTKNFITFGGRALLLDENDTVENYPHPKIRELKELTRYL